MTPPQHNVDFAAAMELVFDVYRHPYDPAHPVVCMDETPTDYRDPYSSGCGDETGSA